MARAVRRHRDQVARSDLRWLLAWVGVFFAGILVMLATREVYRATGPHPRVTALVRRLKHHARWLIPGQKGRRSSEVVPASPPPRYASGHDAQRANA